MIKSKKSVVDVRGVAITVLSQKKEDYISITDIARYKNTERTDDLELSESGTNNFWGAR
jgi:hypothetical protein